MRTTVVRVLTIAGLVAAVGTIGYAAEAQKPAPAAKTASHSMAKSESASGKIVAFDETSKTLTLSTSKGEEKFMLGSTARIQEGAKTITASNLSSLAGHSAKVRYTVSGSDRMAESVMVSGSTQASAKKK